MIVTPYTDIEAADRAAGAPATANLAMALRDDADHDRLIIYDPDRHAPADGEAHRHRGDDSEHVAGVMPNMPNLINLPYPSVGGGGPTWIISETLDAKPAGFAFAAGGQWAMINLGDWSRTSLSRSFLGGGAHLVVSGYLIADRTLEAGGIQMGLVTGSTGDSKDERSFVEGASMTVPFALIDTAWRRYWCVIDTAGMDFNSSARFAVQCSESVLPVGSYVFGSLFDVRVGRMLDYPVPGYRGSIHYDWTGWGYSPTGGAPPPLDHAFAITNAVQLAPG